MFGSAYEHKYECKMPSLCVVFGCSNTPDPKSGISLHKIPYDGNSRPEAIMRRKRWVDFVKRKHAKLEPSSSSWIYSKHLEAGRICSPSKFAGANLHSVAKRKMRPVFHCSQHCSLQAKATKRLLLLLLLNLFTNNSPLACLLLLKGLFYKNINHNIKIFTGYLRDYSFIYNVYLTDMLCLLDRHDECLLNDEST